MRSSWSVINPDCARLRSALSEDAARSVRLEAAKPLRHACLLIAASWSLVAMMDQVYSNERDFP